MTERTRGAHPDDPAEGSREQGEDAETRVREDAEAATDRDWDTDEPAGHE